MRGGTGIGNNVQLVHSVLACSSGEQLTVDYKGEVAMENTEFLHPANAEELANIAQETGAEVLRGALWYPSEGGG